MKYIKIDSCDLNNGEGARVVLWVSGCEFRCENCHNKDTWDFNIGKPFTAKDMDYILKCLDSKYIKGLSILGGEPLHRNNIDEVLNICNSVKEKYPNKDIWIWTGFKIENIKTLPNCDYIIDGLYNKDLPTAKKWRGSDNQRMFNIVDGKNYLLID